MCLSSGRRMNFVGLRNGRFRNVVSMSSFWRYFSDSFNGQKMLQIKDFRCARCHARLHSEISHAQATFDTNRNKNPVFTNFQVLSFGLNSTRTASNSARVTVHVCASFAVRRLYRRLTLSFFCEIDLHQWEVTSFPLTHIL